MAHRIIISLPEHLQPAPQRVSMGFGTWIAVVLVAAIIGALAAFAVMKGHDVYDGLVDESRWSEGKVLAGSVRHALQVHCARNAGTLPDLETGMDLTEFGPIIRWHGDAFHNMRHFRLHDVVLVEVDPDGWEYVLRVRSSVPGGPPGTYYLDDEGMEWMEE